ncbi:MAG TPA: hypothetical protein PKD85_08745, partial [Saprospiraceae bacterium]|nr:hypothetical protein [Saprospiraceae bacterium]
MNKIFFFILSIILLNSCFSSKNVLDGASAFKLKQYQRANELLQQEIEDEKNEGKRAKKAFMIAQSYEYLLQPHLATQWYEKANQSGYGVQSKLALAYAYKINKEYTKSLSLFKELSKYNTLTQECNIQIRGLEDIMKGNQNMGFSYRILNL